MFYLKEINYFFDKNEYEFIKSIPAEENGFVNENADISLEDFLYKALPELKKRKDSADMEQGCGETIFLLINDGVIVGLFRIRHNLCSQDKSGEGHISFYIAPEYRRKGFGRNGLRLAITHAYQIIKDQVIRFKVLESNEGAKKILAANGCTMEREENGFTYFELNKAPVSKDFAMQIALDEAYNGIGNGDGGPFGCVITRDNKIVGRGHNRVLKNEDPTCHGEMEAIRDACRQLKTHDLSGCELYTTAEPCPMCLGGIMWANITKVYYGCNVQDTNDIGFRDEKFYDFLHGKADLLKLENFKRGDCLELFRNYEKVKHLY